MSRATRVVAALALVAALGPCGEGVAQGTQDALGLPPLGLAPRADASDEKVALGRKLFFDRRLSPNNTMSCAMCHVPEQGFTSHELATPVGLAGRSVRRNAPTVLNVAYLQSLFHDGRETSLEEQVWGPLLATNEMGNASRAAVVARIAALRDYRGWFERAFGGYAVSDAGIAEALAAYQRTLIAGNSRFDRWRYGGDGSALDGTERRGFELFTGKAGCAACHTVGERDALFTDQRFHNTGVGWRRSGAASGATRVELVPGVFAVLDRRTLESFSEPRAGDLGRYEVTGDPTDRWAYRTPGLRNVALTAPYMHDGSLPTLDAVIDFYDRGGVDNPGRSALLKPLGLDAGERAALVAFLRSLSSDAVSGLVAAARRAPIGQ